MQILSSFFRFFKTSKRLRGQAPPAAGPALPPKKIGQKITKNQTSKKERKVMPKGLLKRPPIASKSPKQTQNDSQDPFREVLWKTLGKSVATRGPQEAQRTNTRGLNTNPIEPARSKRTLSFLHKTSKCHRKCIHVWPFWTPYRPKVVSFGSKRRARWKYWSHVHSTTK